VKFTARPRDEGQKAFFMKVKMNRWTCGRRRSDLRWPKFWVALCSPAVSGLAVCHVLQIV